MLCASAHCPFPAHPGAQSKGAWGGVGPVPSHKAPTWESGGRGSGWPGGRRLDPSSTVGQTAARSPTHPPLLFLPAAHPHFVHPFLTPSTQPSGWFEGDCGLAGENLAGVLCPQPAHCEPLLPVLLGLCPLRGEQPASPPWLGACAASRKRPLRYPPLPVPTSPGAHLPPSLPMGVHAGLPLQPAAPGDRCQPQLPLLSCVRSPGSPGERGIDIYFLKFALNL